jgi:hypothetical protein
MERETQAHTYTQRERKNICTLASVDGQTEEAGGGPDAVVCARIAGIEGGIDTHTHARI